MSTFAVQVAYSEFHENAPPWRTTLRVTEHDHDEDDTEVVLGLQILEFSSTLPVRAERALGGAHEWYSLHEAYCAIWDFAKTEDAEDRLGPIPKKDLNAP